MLSTLVIFSADDILKYFSYFSQKKGFDISCKLSPNETICLKILFSGTNTINFSSAENFPESGNGYLIQVYLHNIMT